MNWSEMRASWYEMKALVQTHWPRLADVMLRDINGDRAELGRASNANTDLAPLMRKSQFANLKRM